MLTTGQKIKVLRKAAENIRIGRGLNYDQAEEWISYDAYWYRERKQPACGMIGCLGGHLANACRQLKLKPPCLWTRYLPFGGRHAGIFTCTADKWPNKFRLAYERAKTSLGRSRVAAKLLEAIADGKIWPWAK